jgi:hypothetical protein
MENLMIYVLLIKINKKITAVPLLKTVIWQCIYAIEESKVLLVFEHNNVGLKKLSSFV